MRRLQVTGLSSRRRRMVYPLTASSLLSGRCASSAAGNPAAGAPPGDSDPTGDSAQQQPPSILQALRIEFAKLFAVTKHDAATVGKVMMGTDGESPAAVEKEQQHKEALREQMARQQQKDREALQARLAALPSWRERLAAQLHDAKEALKASTSKQSGVAALIQSCAASHAAEVAVEQGIDVQNVQIVLEHQTVKGVAESKVVGYIEAPMASEEEVAVFARRLTKACPAASAYDGHIEWRRRGADAPTDTSTTSTPTTSPLPNPNKVMNVSDTDQHRNSNDTGVESIYVNGKRYRPRRHADGASVSGNHGETGGAVPSGSGASAAASEKVKKEPFKGFRL